MLKLKKIGYVSLIKQENPIDGTIDLEYEENLIDEIYQNDDHELGDEFEESFSESNSSDLVDEVPTVLGHLENEEEPLPKRFQNPLTSLEISSKLVKSKLLAEHSHESDSVGISALFPSLKTISSIYFPSSYNGSEVNPFDFPRLKEGISCSSGDRKTNQRNSTECIYQQKNLSFDHNSNQNESYRLSIRKLSLLGSGSEANIYLAEVSGVDQLYAYKEFNKMKSKEEICREFDLISNLDHTNVLKYFYLNNRSGTDRDKNGIIMELMEGGSLLEYVNKNFCSISPKKKLEIAHQIIDGLDYLHKNNIVHGDLKPENILLTNDKSFVKIADFGMCYRQSPAKSYESRISGTINYMAPEVLLHQQFSKKADVWSLGCVLYFLFNGIHFLSSSMKISDIHEKFLSQNFQDEDIKLPQKIFASLIQKCLVFNYECRSNVSYLKMNQEEEENEILSR